MSLDKATSEQLQAIRHEYDEETIKRNALEIQQWLDEQPHLPSGKSAGLKSLELLFLRCKGNQDKMKESLEVYYGLKNVDPDTLLNRDPDTEWFRNTKDLFAIVPLPTLTPNNCRVMLACLCDASVTKHNPHELLKIANMVSDVRYLTEFCPNDIYILDLQKVTIGHVLKYPISLIRRIYEFGLVGYRVNFRQGHFINAPVYLDILMALVKLVAKPKIFQRIHVHKNGVGNLYDYIPQSVMPIEYGGEAGSLQDLWGDWIKQVESRRDWFLEQDKCKTDESKRPKKKKKSFL